MADFFRVAIHYESDNGYVEYDPSTKKIEVKLAHEAKRHEAEQYLATSHVMGVPQKDILDFKDVTVEPSRDVESLKLALTRIWVQTGVCVDWSRPVNV